MKKITNIFFTIFLFLISTFSVRASNYVQGVVTKGSAIYTRPEASNSTRLLNDTGAMITLYSPEAVEITGESGNYYQIKFLYSGFLYNGYIVKSNITRTVYELSDEYKQSLIQKGFPSEYAERLTILHAIHPNWSFVPSFTGGVNGGLDFNAAVNGEADVIAKNLIDGSNTTLRSTADGAYSNGTWIGLSGSNWFAASRQTISFFMDPRNFLDESHIFMFENLGFNPETQTEAVLSKILGGSFMSNPFECLEGAYICPLGTHSFYEAFMSAGRDKSVSPVHLATRAIQEQGSNGSVLSLGLGYNGNYVGYYNFFNIGASGKTDAEVIENGLKYAKNRNWNNQFASIYDGSSTIASNYIAKGQSTLYYQKFNTIVSPLYGHQYMQNVRAPYSESYNTYVGYYRTYSSSEEWNNAVYDFLIPIYSNMGGATTLSTSENGDATLRSLTITECKMNPDFQSSAYNYDCYLKKEIETVTLNATPTNNLATVEIPNEIHLNNDETEVHVIVTAANGNKSDYKITIHKIETDGYSPTEILNGVGIKTTNEYLSNFVLGSDVSNLINSVVNSYHFATIKVADASNNEVKDGIIKTGYKITVANAGLTSTFKTVIYGDTTGDGVVDIRDLLVIQKHLVKAKTIENEYLVAADINKDGLVDIRDLLLEQKYLLNQYSILQ